MNDFSLLLPEFLVAGLAFFILALDLFIKENWKRYLVWVAFFGLAVILFVSLFIESEGQLYDGLLEFDEFTKFFRIFFLIIGGVTVIISREYVDSRLKYPGEYYGILLFTLLGAMLLASSAELLTAYINLELLSFGLYVLVGYERYNPKSNEASVKYILLGAFSSALILFGISQIYGLLGTTRFDEMSVAFSSLSSISPGMAVGFVLIVSGLGFKLAAVPFHMWAPDVYEGAPLPITAWLSVGSKAAALALAIRLFSEGFISVFGELQPILIVIAAITMVIGNLLALVQKNIKRLLAYSSIGHVGYLLMGLAALVPIAKTGSVAETFTNLVYNGLLFHMVSYGFTTMAAFLCVITVYNKTGRDDISAFAGLSKRQPLVALVFVCALFSLAGLPIFVGFASKFYLFNAVGGQGLLWLVALAIVMSLISLYYYLTIARQLYIENSEDDAPIAVSFVTKLTLGGLFGVMIILGIYPAFLMEAIQRATDVLISGNLLSLV